MVVGRDLLYIKRSINQTILFVKSTPMYHAGHIQANASKVLKELPVRVMFSEALRSNVDLKDISLKSILLNSLIPYENLSVWCDQNYET